MKPEAVLVLLVTLAGIAGIVVVTLVALGKKLEFKWERKQKHVTREGRRRFCGGFVAAGLVATSHAKSKRKPRSK